MQTRPAPSYKPNPLSTTASLGPFDDLNAYLMKSPPRQIVDDEAVDLVDGFIKKNARQNADVTKRGRVSAS
jgi:hypothetical protein